MGYIDGGLGKCGYCIVVSIDPTMRSIRVVLGYGGTPLLDGGDSTTELQ